MKPLTIQRAAPIPAVALLLKAGALGLALWLFALGTAAAQGQCAPHERMTELLSGRYAEAQVAIGLAKSGRLVEVFATEDGATWTIVATTPDGKSCVLDSGEGWDQRSKVALGPEA